MILWVTIFSAAATVQMRRVSVQIQHTIYLKGVLSHDVRVLSPRARGALRWEAGLANRPLLPTWRGGGILRLRCVPLDEWETSLCLAYLDERWPSPCTPISKCYALEPRVTLASPRLPPAPLARLTNLPAQIRLERAVLLEDSVDNGLLDSQCHRASTASWIERCCPDTNISLDKCHGGRKVGLQRVNTCTTVLLRRVVRHSTDLYV